MKLKRKIIAAIMASSLAFIVATTTAVVFTNEATTASAQSFIPRNWDYKAMEGQSSYWHKQIEFAGTTFDARVYDNRDIDPEAEIPNTCTIVPIKTTVTRMSLPAEVDGREACYLSIVMPYHDNTMTPNFSSNLQDVRAIVVPDNYKSVMWDSFYDAHSLEKIIVSSNIEFIDLDGFGKGFSYNGIKNYDIKDAGKAEDHAGKRVLYFDGTKKQWDKLDKSFREIDSNVTVMFSDNTYIGPRPLSEPSATKAKENLKGSITIDTANYKMDKNNRYQIGVNIKRDGVRLSGDEVKKLISRGVLKVTDSRTGSIVDLKQLENGDFLVTGKNYGSCYIVYSIYDGDKKVNHASVKIDVEKGTKQGGASVRNTSVFDSSFLSKIKRCKIL